jgi:superfamily II DNA or RNA helicase
MTTMTARPEVSSWIDRLEKQAKASAATTLEDAVGYRLYPRRTMNGIPSVVVMLLKPTGPKTYSQGQRLTISNIRYRRDVALTPLDRMICGGLEALYAARAHPPEQLGPLTEMLFTQIIGTGRCFLEQGAEPLSLAAPRPGGVEWRKFGDGAQRLQVVAEGGLLILPTLPPWYIDARAGAVGRLDIDLPPEALYAVLTAPNILLAELRAVDQRMRRDGAFASIPLPKLPPQEEIRRVAPVPSLRFSDADNSTTGAMLHACLGVRYGGYEAPFAHALHPRDLRIEAEEDLILIFPRDPEREDAFVRCLYDARFMRTFHENASPLELHLAVPRLDAVIFFAEDAPLLIAEGWEISIGSALQDALVDGSGTWDASLHEEQPQWFSFELGIDIEGERIALLPVLTSLLNKIEGDNIVDSLQHQTRNGKIYAELPDGRVIALPSDRVIQLLSTLIELHGDRVGDGVLFSFSQALSFCSATPDQIALTNDRLRSFADRLRTAKNDQRVAAPKGFRAKLRDYQAEGIGWMQFLRESQIGGILADDMGLGKTIQALGHLLLEKQAGRLEVPALIISPTSVMPNWQSEARRFAPRLNVVTMHGADRMNRLAEIDEADIVLSTYPLLARDQVFQERAWSSVILDEAQVIKNPNAKTAEAARALRAEHKLCLTGTPMENHLGELWSLFEFIMPGMLRDYGTFNHHFRVPIEKRNDAVRSSALMSRVQPFILRRTKESVALELPQKTEVTKRVEIVGDQRDLYETVRLAMDRKVRSEIENRGLARSKIVVLDALLKLRQVCCDPRLLKLPAAKRVKHSAKLTALLAMLEQLMAEKRKVLVFSQFTSMLDLIKPALDARRYAYVEITGQTRDRRTPVEQFQKGDVPIFLISLKAGGTGLNLTAADTVIHYDPWWNPAVERQATDRAHRIGQTKPVFVYKFVVAGSVEERIVELQQRKAALSAAILDAEKAASTGFSIEDITDLFKPLK